MKINLANIRTFVFFKSGLVLLTFFFPLTDIIPDEIKISLFILLIINLLLTIYDRGKLNINYFTIIILLFILIQIAGNYVNSRLLLYFLLYFFTFNLIRDSKDVNIYLISSVAGVIFSSVLVLLNFLRIFNCFFISVSRYGIVRFLGFSADSNPNNFAMHFTLIFPFLIYYFFKIGKKILFLLTIIIIFFIIIFTQSKAVIIPIVILSPLMFLNPKTKKKKILYLYSFLIILIVISFVFLSGNNYFKRIFDFEDGGRGLIWKASFNLFLENPFGYFQQDLKSLIYNRVIYKYGKYLNRPKNTHNLYLYVMLQTGLPGIFFLFFIMFFIFYRSLKNYDKDRSLNYFIISFAIFFFFNLLHLAFFWYYFWIFLGIWSAKIKLVTEENEI